MKRNYLQVFCSFLFLYGLYAPIAVFGQAERLQFVQLTSDEGLSSSVITALMQDYEGFMWIGTQDGLNRYDGVKFVYYKNTPSDHTSLINNVVTALLEDHNQIMYVGTEKGLSIYDRMQDSFRNLMAEESSPLKGIDCTVRKIAEDRSGNLWLATDVGLICYDRKNNKIIQYRHDSANPASLSDDNVESVLIDRDDMIWITNHHDVDILNPLTGSFRHLSNIFNNKPEISGCIFRQLMEDTEGNIWIGSREGLFRVTGNIDGGNSSLKHYRHDNNVRNSLTLDLINSIFTDRSGNVWIGTENGGINLFDRKTDGFIHIRRDEADPQSLSNESIEATCQDNAGNLWFGTYTGGINIAMKNREAITKYQNQPGAVNCLSYNSVTSFEQDSRGNLWIGTDGGGLNLFDENENHFIRYNTANSNLTSNSVLAITVDSHNILWLGTWEGGLVRFEPDNQKFTAFTTSNSGIQDDNIFAVTEGFNNDLWLGSFEHGLIHYQIDGNKFTAYTQANSQVGNNMIVKLIRLAGKKLLLGTTMNFQIFNTETNQFITYNANPESKCILTYPRVTDIAVQSDTCIWIGTPNGLNRLNPVTNTVKYYFEKDGLPEDFIKGLAIDNSGDLWITSNHGVCRFNVINGARKSFYKGDGIQSNEFNERSILKLKSGSLVMGGVKGFNIVNPLKIKENRTIPNVMITGLKIFNKNIRPGVKGSPLPNNITETRTLTLNHNQSVLTFTFAVLDFSAPEKNRYAYKMENFDRDWIYSENRNEATYTNLNPGNYTFTVIGSNNDGIWNTTGVAVNLVILPPWWNTLWFKTLVLVLVVLMFTSVYLYRVSILKQQGRLLERTVEIKTAELKELNASKDKFFSIIAHDLKNPFSTILGFSEMLVERLDEKIDPRLKEYAQMIYNSAHQTFRLLENLLEWANSQRGKITFKPVPLNLSDILNEEIKTLCGSALAKQVSLQYEIPQAVEIIADRNMIRTICRNLISNAIKFTPRNGVIMVKCETLNGMISVSVSDSGVGMTRETISKLFRIDTNYSTKGTEGEKGTGLGLLLCKEFADKHLGQISVDSSPGKGSTFIVRLPLHSSSL